jgi:hypothetical protein
MARDARLAACSGAVCVAAPPGALCPPFARAHHAASHVQSLQGATLQTLTPPPDLYTSHLQLGCNILVLHSRTCQQHDSRASRQPHAGKPRPSQLNQRFPLLRSQIDFRCSPHFSLSGIVLIIRLQSIFLRAHGCVATPWNESAPTRCPRRAGGSGQGWGYRGRAYEYWGSASRCGLASSYGRHCCALRGSHHFASLRLALHLKNCTLHPAQLPDLGLTTLGCLPKSRFCLRFRRRLGLLTGFGFWFRTGLERSC